MDIKQFVAENKDKFDARELAVVQTELNAGRSVAWVNEEMERGLFTWFLLGHSSKQIAEVTKTPEAWVIVTRVRYDWTARREQLMAASGQGMVQLIKETTMQIFAMARLAIAKDHQDVMAGLLDPRKSAYVPRSSTQLKEMFEVVQALQQEEVPPAPANTTVQVLVQTQEAPKVLTSGVVETKPPPTTEESSDTDRWLQEHAAKLG
jgi:hypothetical protein